MFVKLIIYIQLKMYMQLSTVTRVYMLYSLTFRYLPLPVSVLVLITCLALQRKRLSGA